MNRDVYLLFIGNSFSVDAAIYLPKLLELNDIDFKIGILYAPGASLDTHISNFDKKAAYTYYEYTKQNGYWTKGSRYIQTALEISTWTDIILHLVSHLSYQFDTISDSLPALIQRIKSYIDYDININYMLTPAYGKGNQEYFADMYNQINETGLQILNNIDINQLIPVHTAIESARTNTVLLGYGNDLFASSSDRHIEDGVGRLIEAYAVYMSLQLAHANRISLSESTFVPLYEINVFNGSNEINYYPDTSEFAEITPEVINLINKVAIATAKNPYLINIIE